MYEKLSKLVIVKMPPSLADELQAAAQHEARTQSAIVRRAVENYLKGQNKSVASSGKNQHNAFVVGN